MRVGHRTGEDLATRTPRSAEVQACRIPLHE